MPRTALAALVLTLAACGSPTTSSSISTVPTGRVTDPAGDAVLVPVVRNGVTLLPPFFVLPDLVGATIEIANGALTATITFAPSTRSGSDTIACVMLDVDENAATGERSVATDVPLGYDYSVCASNPRGSATAQITRFSQSGGLGIGALPATFPTNDQTRVTVPLAMLGNDDGRVAFKVNVSQWVDGPVINTAIIDWMPDIGQPAGTVR